VSREVLVVRAVGDELALGLKRRAATIAAADAAHNRGKRSDGSLPLMMSILPVGTRSEAPRRRSGSW
jgi:hypothetical protein